jgi:hypothetical protein
LALSAHAWPFIEQIHLQIHELTTQSLREYQMGNKALALQTGTCQ